MECDFVGNTRMSRLPAQSVAAAMAVENASLRSAAVSHAISTTACELPDSPPTGPFPEWFRVLKGFSQFPVEASPIYRGSYNRLSHHRYDFGVAGCRISRRERVAGRTSDGRNRDVAGDQPDVFTSSLRSTSYRGCSMSWPCAAIKEMIGDTTPQSAGQRFGAEDQVVGWLKLLKNTNGMHGAGDRFFLVPLRKRVSSAAGRPAARSVKANYRYRGESFRAVTATRCRHYELASGGMYFWTGLSSLLAVEAGNFPGEQFILPQQHQHNRQSLADEPG